MINEIDPRSYARQVLAGKIVTGEFIQLAVERDEKDRKNGAARGLYFDHDAGMRAIRFFHQFLNHYEGAFAGKPFVLAPWQAWITYTVFGWMRADGTRRYRYAYIEVAKKNGKTPWMAGHLLYHLMLMTDKEPGAQVYAAASTQSQANIAFKHARIMAKNSPEIFKRLQIETHNVMDLKSNSVMRALSSEYTGTEGVNVHAALVDEYHVHKTDGVFESLKSATVSRRQPLIWIITTAGFNKNGPCYDYRKMVINVLRGVLNDDAVFGAIYAMDEDAEYEDEANWIKANPNLGVSVQLESIRSEFTNAKNQPTKLVNFLTKNMNMWVDAATTWIKDASWMACAKPFELSECEDMEAYGGLDLSAVRDFTAFTLAWPWIEDGNYRYRAKTWYFIPQDTIQERVRETGVPVDVWLRLGFVIATPGNAVDYAYIKLHVIQMCKLNSVKSVAYDRWNSSALVADLISEGVPMEEFGQGFGSMSSPTKELDKLVARLELEHCGDPVTRWMMSNVMISTNPAGDVKPDKQKSGDKIDGIVSLIMSIGIHMKGRVDADVPGEFQGFIDLSKA